jgi:hypothetical protein
MKLEEVPRGGCVYNKGKNRYALERDKFCGEPALEGKPYCHEHCLRAYRQWVLSEPKLNFDPYSEDGKPDAFDPLDAIDIKPFNRTEPFKGEKGKSGKKK